MLENWGNYFIDFDDQDYKETLKNVRSKLEIPMVPVMPCKRMVHTGTTKVVAKQEVASQKIPKTIYGCIVESHESTGQRMESSVPTKHEDRIVGKGFTSTPYSLVPKFIPLPQAMKIPGAKAAVNKKWKKLETIPAWQLDKVKEPKEGYFGSTKRQKESPLCYIDGHLSSQKCWVWTKNSKYKGRTVLGGDIVTDDAGAYAVFTEQGSSSFQMTVAKAMDVVPSLPDCDGQAAAAVSAYTQVKLEDAPRLLGIPKSECPDFWIRLPRHKWPKSWANIEDPVVPLERNLYGHTSAGLLWETQFEKVLLELGWEKVANWESVSWRTNIISWPRMFGMYSSRMQTEWKLLLRNIQGCLNHVFLQEQLKSYLGGESLTQSRWHGPTTWKDMLENALSDIASWQTRKVEQ